jgi:hypothetical protein
MVKFRKEIRDDNKHHTPYYVTVILKTDELGAVAHEAMDYLEAAIKVLPERMGEPAVVEHIHGLCGDCEHKRGNRGVRGMSRNEFLAILDMRQDELDDSHRAALMESALKIVLDKPTWKERVIELHKVWGEVQTSQLLYRRGLRNHE